MARLRPSGRAPAQEAEAELSQPRTRCPETFDHVVQEDAGIGEMPAAGQDVGTPGISGAIVESDPMMSAVATTGRTRTATSVQARRRRALMIALMEPSMFH
jgi:hypothetical protein